MPAPDDLDLKMAIAVGLGMTIEEAADAAGLKRAVYYQRYQKNPDFYTKWTSYTEVVAERTVALRVSKIAATETAEERIKKLFGRAFSITEKVIAKAEALGDEITLAEAMAVHKEITVWASKFTASEAPRRLQLSGGILHGHVALQDDTVNALHSLQQHLLGIPALAAGAITVNAEPETAS